MDTDCTFNCNGKVNANDWQLNRGNSFLRGEIENVVLSHKEFNYAHMQVELFGSTVPGATAIFNLKHFIKCMEMRLKILNRHETYHHLPNNMHEDKTDFYLIRITVCEFLVYIRSYLNSIKWNIDAQDSISAELENDLNELLIVIKNFLGRLRGIPDSTFHYTASTLGNKCLQPEFHMYHMHLELRWLCITLIYSQTVPWKNSCDNNPDLDIVLGTVIKDLMYIATKLFERIPLADLRQKTPYTCTCMRELWLMLQIFIDNLSTRSNAKTFWDHINTTLSEVSDVKNLELFSIWMIYHMALLYGYNNDGVYLDSGSARIKPNYDQVEKVLKNYVNKGGKDGERDDIDEELKVMIPLLRILISEWWQPRLQVIYFLWDCFHRRLDQPFLMQTSGPWTVSLEKKTPADILKQVKERIEGNFEQNKESSYGMFLRFLGSFLRRNYSTNDPKVWNQIKGRVYSKFSESKVKEFSEPGLYNFISLFLTLAVTTDTENCSMMLKLLPSISKLPSNDSKKRSLIWKGNLAVVLLYNERRISYYTVTAACIPVVNAMSCCKDEATRSIMSSFVDVLGVILSNSESMNLDEYTFIDGWVDRYFLECPKNRAGPLINLMINVFKKCTYTKAESPGIERMLNAMWNFLAGRARQLVFDLLLVSQYYESVAELAFLFTLHAVHYPAMAKKHSHSAVSLFQHFSTSIMIKDIRITRAYLTLILEKEEEIKNLRVLINNFDTFIIQAWIKCSILNNDETHEQSVFLRKYVANMDQIKKVLTTVDELQEFQNGPRAIFFFIMMLMKKRALCQNQHDRAAFDEKFCLYFNNVHKWILGPITDESINSDLSVWIYRCIGTLIFCCSPMLYASPKNMLRDLIARTLLPHETEGPAYVISIAKQIFSLVILGLESLNVRADIYLQGLIRDLFARYLPLLITDTTGSRSCKISESLLKCFQDAKSEFLGLILEILSGNFIITFVQNTTHKICYLVMLLLRNVLKAGTAYKSCVIELIVTICTTRIVGCYVKVHEHHPHRQQTLDFINEVMCSCYYKENVLIRNKFQEALSRSVDKCLLTNPPQSTFEFIRVLGSISPTLARGLLPKIESYVYDAKIKGKTNIASLRHSLEKLRNSLGLVRNPDKIE
ncbi:protein MMS22-like isoform X2 [Cephus cinctus]|uniref:Protein MMS22-like n=1 Tax=Cephus cinctus TaxID=211228 RepID=A0AAJ7FQ58_CEPCN|nr:protein MMS22-like isoform X2 [Cephus cinctus]